MKAARITSLVETSMIVLFVALAGAILFNLWGHVPRNGDGPETPAVFANPATVRLSAREVIEQGGDTSGMACYACHEQGKVRGLKFGPEDEVVLPDAHRDLIYYRMNCVACHDESEGVEIEFNDDGKVIIPEAHQGSVLRHGRGNRNNDCYNCHVSTNLTALRTLGGQTLTLAESTQLCAGCHGPTYRDWEAGIHGRLYGSWDPKIGERLRTDCTSCHDPHSPAFPNMKPGPAPYPSLQNHAATPVALDDADEKAHDE